MNQLSGTVFQNAMTSKLKALSLPTQIARQSEAFIGSLHIMKADDPIRAGILQAYVHGFKAVWVVITIVSGTALAVSFIIRKFSMDRILRSSYTARA
jgi:hypothetical protein